MNTYSSMGEAEGAAMAHNARMAAEVQAARRPTPPAMTKPPSLDMMTPQQCPAGKHADWAADSENAHACPWCEIDRLRAEAVKEERAHLATIGERDYAQSMADKLAAAIAPEDVLGEHSDGNFPWQNALDWAPEKERTTAALLAMVEQLTKERNRFRFAWNNARARAATLAENVEFVERQANAAARVAAASAGSGAGQ